MWEDDNQMVWGDGESTYDIFLLSLRLFPAFKLGAGRIFAS